jgi:site-specific recombinase XerD
MVERNAFATNEEQERFDDFVGCLLKRGRRASTTRSYRSDWLDLSLWFRRQYSEGFDASRLDANVVEGWRNASEDRGKSSSTILRRMAFARTYLRWMTAKGIQPTGAYEEIRSVQKNTKVQRIIRYLKPEEVNRLLEYIQLRACLRDQAMIHVLLDGGVRISELVQLDVGDVNFEKGALTVRGGRERDVPLPTRTTRKLAWSLGERGLLDLPDSGEIILPASGGWPPTSLVEPPDVRLIPALQDAPQSPMPFGVSGTPSQWPLFVGEKGRLSVNGVQRVVRKHAAFARVETTPQILRNTFAMNIWSVGQDLVGLAEMMGLESVESAKIYAQMGVSQEASGEQKASAKS